MAKGTRKTVLYFFLAILVIGALYIIFNDYGVIRYLKLSSELDEMKSELEILKDENQRLKNEVDSLKNKIPAKMEQVAREKYNLKREGETTIEVKEE
jgi:cell division protein FtsL